MADSKQDAPNWLHRVEEDEMRTLVRASANYARQGYDPGLATLQAKAVRKEEDKALSMDPVGRGRRNRQKKFENNYLGTVPTHYKNMATGRVLSTAMPQARPYSRIQERAPEPISQALRDAAKQAVLSGTGNKNSAKMVDDDAVMRMAGMGHKNIMDGLHPSRIPLVHTAQVTYHPVDQQRVVLPQSLTGGGPQHVNAKNINNVGLSRAALAAIEDQGGANEKVPRPSDVLKRYKLFNARGDDEAQGRGINSQLNTEARHKDQPARAIGPGTVVAENFAALNSSGTMLNMHPPSNAVQANAPGLPVGAASHAILQNRMGRAGAAPGPQARGGSGLVVGELLISYEQLVPATLVASKWGRISTTQYSDIPGVPCRIGVEVQPLYYESFLSDLHTVLDRSGGYTFEPLVAPGAFVVDFGRVNAHVHGHARPDTLPSKAGIAIDRAMDGSGYEAPKFNSEGKVMEEEGAGAGNTAFSIGDVGFGAMGKGKTLASDDLRAARQRVAKRKVVAKEPTREDVQRAEMSAALDTARERARLLLLKLAEDGMDTAVEKLIKDGLRVEWNADPYYVRAAEEKERQAKSRAQEFASAEGSSGPPPLGDGDGGGGGTGGRSQRPRSADAQPPKQKDVFVKPEVDHKDSNGNTALMLAAKHGWIEIVLLLLRNGADHKRKNNAGQSSLDLAKAESNSASLALSVGVQGAAQRKRRAAKLVSMLDDRTVLVCAQKGDLKRMEYLVDDCEHPVNAVNQYGMTPLHFAILRKDAKMAKFLRERGADINARNNLGQSPLSLVLDLGRDAGQKALLGAMDIADLAAAEERAKLFAMEEERMQRQRDEEKLVSKLKSYTKGTTAARAVYAALANVGKAGTTADFSAAAAGSALPKHGRSAAKGGFNAPALSKTIGLVTSPMGQGRGRAQSASAPHGHSSGGGGGSGLGPIQFKKITASERTGLLTSVYGGTNQIHPDHASEGLRGASKGLAESWNRHVSNYIAVAERQQHALDSRLQRVETEASELASSEVRAGRLNPAEVSSFVHSHVSRARAQGPSYSGTVDAGKAATDPSAMISAERGLRNITVPPADSARFDAWARMRFGVA